MTASERRPGSHGSGSFRTTHWSVVQAAGADDPAKAREALTALCENYWYPLYAFVRRSGYSADDSSDLTQGFFARLLEKKDFRTADPERGKFRSFLLASLKHFLANERDRSRAQKRGGGRVTLSVDFRDADARYGLEPGDQLTPETVFERNWALAVLARTSERLGEEYAAQGKGILFDRLKWALTGDEGGARRLALAEELGLTKGALNVAIHRLRKRFRERLRAEIGQTVEPGQVDEELRELFSALGS